MTTTPDNPKPSRRSGSRRPWGGGTSVLSDGEGMVWLTGGGLVISLAMILGVVALIVSQGLTTFWPVPVVQLKLVTGNTVLGEVTRDETFTVNYGTVVALTGAESDAAAEVLNPLFRALLRNTMDAGGFGQKLAAAHPQAIVSLHFTLDATPSVRDAEPADRAALVETINSVLADTQLRERLADRLRELVETDNDGTALYTFWRQQLEAEDTWHQLREPRPMAERLADDEVAFSVFSSRMMTVLSTSIETTLQRRLVRTGNFDLTGTHFTWVSEFAVVPGSESTPEWAVVCERMSWGRFYGLPLAFVEDGEVVAEGAEAAWQRFQQVHPMVRARLSERRHLEDTAMAAIDHRREQARLRLRRIELRSGTDSAEWQAAYDEINAVERQLDAEADRVGEAIRQLDAENERFALRMQTLGGKKADGQVFDLPLAEVVRAYPANQLDPSDKRSVYLSRWWEFLSDEPREANSEGGVFPAIFGTVVMTLLLSVLVVPFGVLAALYLREYAKAGPLVSLIRIAVNNLAGVPSIVFGVFGLGFFCYIVGWQIDQLFFAERLPSPTYGTGGIFWAALTLALLTLPVVIVATEEALAAVPRTMREGSLACGATKWQTIWRIVLPRSAPGIMTGAILAMARGAGEVAPLMLVGAVKLAPDLPVDQFFPYIHPERSFMHLGFHIYDLGFQSQNSEAAKPMVFTTTLLLIALIAIMNMMAMALRARLRAKFSQGSHV